MVAAAVVVGLALQRAQIGPSNIALVFLISVLMAAVTHGLWPALLACLASVLAYNFFFFPPLYTFTIADPGNVVTLFFFALVAIVASNLAARVRDQAVSARERAAMTESLYSFSRKLAEVFALDDLLWAICFHIAQMLKVRVVILLPSGGILAVCAGYPPEDGLDEADMNAAKEAWTQALSGECQAALPGGKYLFSALRTGRGPVGLVGLENDQQGPRLAPEQRKLFAALADQAALAIERVNLARDIDRARLAAETERLRAALLTSISHDLKTPLASILGSADSLRAHRAGLDAHSQAELIATIAEEAERLNRFIANLLDMTRLESGALKPNLDAVDLGDVIGSALHRGEAILARHRILLDIAPDLPLLTLDPVLFEQVLFNILDNAAKYAPAGSLVSVRAQSDGQHIRIEIADQGSGIPQDDLERIFDMFYRVELTDRTRAGTGLGLAICRGFVEAMGGTIIAQNRQDGPGAVFTISFPAALQPHEDASRDER
jgi:two-component system sensor histidine kinase KdpD